MKTQGLVLPVIAAGCLVYAVVSIARTQPVRELTAPPSPPPRSEFLRSVAAVGLIEPSSEKISMGSLRSGVVEKVLVKLGDTVKTGQALVQLDIRDLQAQRAVELATLDQAQAQVRVAEAELDQARKHLDFANSLRDARALSSEEKTQRETSVATAEAQLAAARTAVGLAQARLKVVDTDIDRSTVRAPLDATVLQLKVRAGEYVPAAATASAWLTLGRTDPLHVRADVDEHEACRVRPGAVATAEVRGDPARKITLEFVKFEPLVVPKQSLTGDATERVDTRVLQVIYRVKERPSFPLFVGQQVDIFIDAGTEVASAEK